MIHNGTELQAMTHNGVEVQTWIHNGVEVYSSSISIIKNGQLNAKYPFKGLDTDGNAIEITQQESNVRFSHLPDGGLVYIVNETIIDLTKFSKLKFKVDTAQFADWAHAYSLGLCTSYSSRYPQEVIKTEAIIDCTEYEVDISALSGNAYIYIGLVKDISSVLDISELHFE